MLKMKGFILAILVGVLAAVSNAGAAQPKKVDPVKACQRNCGNPATTDATQYERCMVDCKSKAADTKKLKNDPRIH